jgi:DNA repair protein RadD
MLRDYQVQSLEEIRTLFAQKIRRVLLKLPTGAGKTKIFCEMLKLADQKNTPSLLVVHMNQLIRQTEERLTQEGVKHGVIQGNRTRDEYENVRVCSIQTLTRRKYYPPAKFVVIDEAHVTGSKSYLEFLEHYKDAFILAVTATPHLKKGMRHVADAVVSPIGVRQLIERGYLVPGKYYSCPKKVDLSGVSISNGDYNTGELAEKMSVITGDVVEHYLKYAQGLPALMFAVNVEHSLQLTKSFNDAGIPCRHVDANVEYDERMEIIGQLEQGIIKVISSIGTLTTGFDCPALRVLIICRPTKSYNLHIQILGRGSRPYPGKSEFLVLDHAGNTIRHGFYETDKDCELDAKESKRTGNADAFLTECENCFAIFHLSSEKCPRCGHINNKKPEKIPKTKDGELTELLTENWEVILNKILAKAKREGYKKGWVYHQIQAKIEPQDREVAWKRCSRMRKWPTRESHPEMFTRIRNLSMRF